MYLGAALFRGRSLLEAGAYFDLSLNGAALIRGWCLLKTHCFLEEIQYTTENCTKTMISSKLDLILRLF